MRTKGIFKISAPIGSIVGFVAVLLACDGQVGADAPKASSLEWNQFGGNPSRNMVSTTAKNLPTRWIDDEGEFIPTKVLWSADLGSRAYGGPIVAAGKVFIGTNNQNPRDKKYREANGRPIDLGVLMAFEQTTGKFLWQTVFPKLGSITNDWPLEGLRAAPTVERDRMYYINNRSDVVCSDLNGNIVWRLDMIGKLRVFPHAYFAGNPPSSVLVVGDDLYLVTNNGVDENHVNIPSPQAPSFLKLSKKDGKILWQDNSPTVKFLTFKSPVQQMRHFMELVNRGELIQHAQYSNPAHAFVNGESQIVFPGGDGWIYSFTTGGKLIWRFDCNPKDSKFEFSGKGTRSEFMATPVIWKNRVYIGMGQDVEHQTGVGHLWCIDMTKKGDVSPEIVVNADVWPPITKPNPNSAKVWHYGGPIKNKDEQKKLRRRYYFGRTTSTCAIYNDLVYAADINGNAYCFDANSGILYWQHDGRVDIQASPFWADGKVYFGTDDGLLVFAHGKEKKLLAENEMGERIRAAPVAVGDVLYLIAGSKLYALKN